jgi:hypothetical protein
MASLQEKLQNFNLASLQNTKIDFDLSQIDFKNVQASLSKRVDILTNIALILATIFIVRYVFIETEGKITTINSNLTQLEEKQTTVVELEKQKKAMDSLLKTLPEGFSTETEIIKKVIGLAADHDVTVTFYTPTQAKIEELYTTQTIRFIFESSYTQMLALVRAIEQNKKNLRLNSWKKETASQYRQNMKGQKTAQKENIIKWEISLSSTTLNNEQ